LFEGSSTSLGKNMFNFYLFLKSKNSKYLLFKLNLVSRSS